MDKQEYLSLRKFTVDEILSVVL